MSAVVRRLATSVAALTLTLAATTGCGVVDDLTGADPALVAATPSAVADVVVDSQFTRDGTYQSHVDYQGLDLVYTIYPTKATPRTNEWFPAGQKFFSFTFQAYDLQRELRAPFASKRKVYLSDVAVTSSTVLASGQPGNQQPYTLDAKAAKVTFDPEPVIGDHGMLVTSPKGAFELRNQAIGEMSADTRGLTLDFRAVVWVQKTAGGTDYKRHVVTQSVPIAIFASDVPTAATPIPVNAG